MIAKVKVMIIKRKLESRETKTAIMERFMYAHVAKVMTSKEKLIFFLYNQCSQYTIFHVESYSHLLQLVQF